MNRSLFIGWAKISSGNFAAGILRLVALVIAARALGVDPLGLIVLIEAYVRVVDGLLNFQSVNVMTRFLAEVDPGNDGDRFRGLVKAGLIVDTATAVATCVLAVCLLPVLAPIVGIGDEWVSLGMLFSLVILTRILGTAEAVLRCFDGFLAIGHRESVGRLIIVIASLVAWREGAGAEWFLMIWMGGEVFANVLFLVWTFVVLRRHGVHAVWSGDARRAIGESPQFWTLLWQTNLTFGIRVLSQYGDLLIAGAVLGTAQTSLLRAAKNLAGIASMFGRPLQQVASAPIARLWAGGDSAGLLQYTRRTCIIAAVAGLVVTAIFAVVGDLFLYYLFGSEFVDAEATVAILMLANAVFLSGVTLLPTMITIGLSTAYLYAIIAGTVAYGVVLGASVVRFGNEGIACAHVAFLLVWAVYGWQRVISKAGKGASR